MTLGGNGSGYYDTSGGNSGGAYRAGDVDIEWCAEGTYDIGWTKAGEWLNYTVSVGAAGSYNLDLRVSSTRGGTIRVEFNGVDKTGSISVPVTGDWQSWHNGSENRRPRCRYAGHARRVRDGQHQSELDQRGCRRRRRIGHCRSIRRKQMGNPGQSRS